MPKRKRNIMAKFKINEISGVDVPAQAGAVVSFIKRDGQAPARSPRTT